MNEHDAALREVYGTVDSLVRESYRPYQPSVTPSMRRDAVKPKPRKPVVRDYRVTSDARVLCECGVYVYTESRNGNPPVLPASCWRCERPIQ